MKSAYIDCTEFGHSLLAPDLLQRLPGMQIHVGDPDPRTLDELLDGAVAIINGHTPMDRALLERQRGLRTIVFLGTGASTYIDLDAAQRLGIQVRTVQGYGDRAVAEHAFALMLAAVRHVAGMDRALRRGIWETPIGMELGDRKLGVIGTGGTGRALIEMAHGFGMEVLAFNRTPPAQGLPCTMVPLETLLRSSHVVSLHLALNEQTRGVIGRAQLALLHPQAVLVNVARSALVDEQALIDALHSGRLAHAALDVFDREPIAPDHPLTRLDNVTLTAHGAYKTHEAMTRLLRRGLELLEDALREIT